jgi:hypothetical protein
MFTKRNRSQRTQLEFQYLDILSANGNYRNIGKTTSDSSGTYSLQWTPDITGKFTVTASFAGSASYYTSHAIAAFAVDAAPSASPAPTTAAPSTVETYFVPSVIAIIVAIAIVGALQTVNRNYASEIRETNHAFWNNSDDWGYCYFDRETGMLVELCRTHRFVSNITDDIEWKTDVIEIVDTSRWEIKAKPSAFSPLFIVSTAAFFALLLLLIVTCLLVTRRTRRRLQVDGRANYK